MKNFDKEAKEPGGHAFIQSWIPAFLIKSSPSLYGLETNPYQLPFRAFLCVSASPR
nr:hypothetical protein [uncultured bacterium]